MNKIGLALLIGLVGSSVACSSGGGDSGSSAPDFVSIENNLNQPSGTFAAGQEGAVSDGFGTQQDAAGNNPFGGGSSSSSSSTTKSAADIHIERLRTLSDDASTCPGLENGGKGSCACPSGGSLDYDLPAQGSAQAQTAGNIDQTVSLIAHSCATSTASIDGSVFWKVKSPPLVQIFSVHLTVTGKDAGKYDVEYLYKDGALTFAVNVPDGHVLVSAKGNWDRATKTGQLTIVDKNETWNCTLTNGKGTCESSLGTKRSVGS